MSQLTRNITKAANFNSSVKRSEFLVSFEIVANLFAYTKTLSIKLKSSKQDLSMAKNNIKNIIALFNSIQENPENTIDSLFENTAKKTQIRKKGNKQSKLHGHSTSKQHLTCMAKWEAYISTITIGSVHSQVASSHKLLVEKNVQYIKTLVDIILFLSYQGLAFRGHEEYKLSLNQEKNYTLGKVAILIKSVLQTFENNRSTLAFNHLWLEIQDFAKDYNINFDIPFQIQSLLDINSYNLKSEITVVKNYLTLTTGKDDVSLEDLKTCIVVNVYPNMYKLLQVALTLPISSATSGAKAQDLFEILDNLMSENSVDWTKCVGVCTDGARSMSGCYGGLQALIQNKAPDALWTHCIIHREALASKYLSPELNQVLECVLNVVNYIKTRSLKSRFFKKLCEDMGAEHTSLLYYSSARWLSRGNMILRTFELREEIYVFIKEEGHKHASEFSNKEFLIKLAYLCDIFDKLNSLNTSLQGKNMHLLKKMNEGTSKDSFLTLQQFLTSNGVEITQDMKSIFVDHLSQLVIWFEKYFQNENIDKFSWIQDPFNSTAPSEFTSTEEESLIELSCDNSLKTKFSSMDLTKFWISIKDEYPLLSDKAQRILIPFSTSYLCEAGFSAVAVIKSKYRTKINVEKEMRVAVSCLIPRFEKMCSDMQAHPSH
ncbi:hypothetical protein QTP88_010244 [Uroleucon formosanum]